MQEMTITTWDGAKTLDMDDINYLSLNWLAGFLNHQQEGTVYQLCCKVLEFGAPVVWDSRGTCK